MNYQQALDYIYRFIDPARSGPQANPNLNLVRTQALLAALGNPQQGLKCVVVAGTKGKGSTCALIESIARHAGMRVGLWTSPHLHTYRERIQVDRRLISETDLIRIIEQIAPAVDALLQSPSGPPSTFALGMGLALRYFAEQQVDLVILEVGLGGRYDSANVVQPVLSVLCSISYDHMEFLGNTLTEIATEKAGILKPGGLGITIEQPQEAQVAIETVARAVGARWFVCAKGAGVRTHATAATVVHFDPYAEYKGPQTTALEGVFQRENACLAVGAALLLRDGGLAISDAAIADGLAQAQWPARFEVLDGTPPVVIDGAHNGDSCRRLVESLQQRFAGQRIVLVFGSSRDKDLERMLAELVPAVSIWVLTHSGHPRALIDLAALHDRIMHADPHAQVQIVPVVADALSVAQALAEPDGVVCVTGSLFVAAAARESLGLAEERDPPFMP
jgi:dihydrofolate synthase/folylpolyglutamate synthase